MRMLQFDWLVRKYEFLPCRADMRMLQFDWLVRRYGFLPCRADMRMLQFDWSVRRYGFLPCRADMGMVQFDWLINRTEVISALQEREKSVDICPLNTCITQGILFISRANIDQVWDKDQY